MTREQLLDAIKFLLERSATCPQVAAAVIRTLTVAVILTSVGGVAKAQLAQVPLSVRTVTPGIYDPAVGGYLTPAPGSIRGVYVIGVGGCDTRSDDAHPARHVAHGHRSNRIRHAEENSASRDAVTEYHERSAARLDAEEAANDAAFNSRFEP